MNTGNAISRQGIQGSGESNFLLFERRGRDLLADVGHSGVDEYSGCLALFIADDLPAYRIFRVITDAGQFHRQRICPSSVAVHSGQPNRSVTDDSVKAGCLGKFIAVPQHLIPTPALYPFDSGIGLRKIQHTPGSFRLRLCTDQVDPKQ